MPNIPAGKNEKCINYSNAEKRIIIPLLRDNTGKMKEKGRKKGLFEAIAGISREAMTVFSCGMSTVALIGAALITRIASAMKEDPLGAVSYYAPMLEYIMMTVLIVVAGTAAFDLMDKKKRQRL